MLRLFGAVPAVAADPALRGRLQRGFLWNVIAASCNQGTTFLLSLLVANRLGREEFGAYALILSTLMLFGSVAQLSMGFTTMKYVAELRSSAPARVGRIITMCGTVAASAGLAASAAAWAFAPFISRRILAQPAIEPLIRLGAVIVFFVCVSSVFTGALAGFEHYRTIAVIGACSGTIYLAGGILAGIRWKLPGVIAAIAISWGVQTMLLGVAVLLAARRHSVVLDGRAFREMFAERSLLFTFALPSALTGFTIAPTMWIVNALLAGQVGGITQVAIFSAASSLRTVVLLAPLLLNNVGFSILNNVRGRGDETAYRRTFLVNLAAVTAMTIAAMAALLAVAPHALRAFGTGFEQGQMVLVVLLLSTPLEALGTAMNLAVQTRGRMWFLLLRITLPRDGAIVAVAFLLVPRYGAIGGSIAFLTGAAVALITIIVHTRHIAIRKE